MSHQHLPISEYWRGPILSLTAHGSATPGTGKPRTTEPSSDSTVLDRLRSNLQEIGRRPKMPQVF